MTHSTETLRTRIIRYLVWNFGYNPPVWSSLVEFQDFVDSIELPVDRETVSEIWNTYTNLVFCEVNK
jgi:hypothetical protein